jgi:HAE1 family hydrophobic/amphiphilic exporter-1
VFLIRHKWVTLVIFAVTIGLLWFSSATMKKGFVPNEDRGIIFTNVELPAGASMERTYNFEANSEKALKIPGIKNVTISTGRGFLSGTGSNYGLAFIRFNLLMKEQVTIKN